MARIRTIKPEFFTSSDILTLTPLARLFYVSLWCEADREGLLKWDTDTLKFRYFPKDKVDIEALGAELVEQSLITILVGDDGREYAEIPSFGLHQVINNRESESVLSARVKDASPRVLGEGKEGKEGKGKERRAQPRVTSPSFDPLKDLEAKGVPLQVANDWLKLRKDKRAAVTQTVIDDTLHEAKRAGLSLEAALRISCRRGWQGFDASWVRDADIAALQSGQKKQEWE